MTELAEMQGRKDKMSIHQPSWLQPGATLLLPVGTSIAPVTAPDRGNTMCSTSYRLYNRIYGIYIFLTLDRVFPRTSRLCLQGVQLVILATFGQQGWGLHVQEC